VGITKAEDPEFKPQYYQKIIEIKMYLALRR
jgi:hypothetical protein